MSGAHYTATDIANVYKLDVRVVLETMERLGLKAPLTLAQAEVVRAAARPETVLDKLPEWVVAAFVAVYERAYAEGQRAANLKEEMMG